MVRVIAMAGRAKTLLKSATFKRNPSSKFTNNDGDPHLNFDAGLLCLNPDCLDLMDETLFCGALLMESQRGSLTFRRRWVKLTKSGLNYGDFPDSSKLEIPLTDIGLLVSKIAGRDGLKVFKNDGDLCVEVKNENDLASIAWIEDKIRDRIQDIKFGEHDFVLVASDEGYFRGRIFRFRASTTFERDLWRESIILTMKLTPGSAIEHVSSLRRIQIKCRRFYESPVSQIIAAALIGASFIMTMAESQILPDDGTVAESVFSVLGDFFNWIFTAELAFNFFCNFLTDFLRDPWNWFDTFVVVSRFLLSSVGGGAQILRCIRAIRIFRLFKRVRSLLRLIKALLTSMPKMLNALALVLIMASIYAILAVQFFADIPGEEGCGEVNTCPGDLFGMFARAFFTMFQVMTLDGWADTAKALMRTTSQPALVGLFFISFLLLVTYTLLQVVICVLVGEFQSACAEIVTVKLDEKGRRPAPPFYIEMASGCPLEPMVRALLDEDNLEHLDRRIREIFAAVSAGSDTVGCDGLISGLRGLHLLPPVILDRGQWDLLVRKRGLCIRVLQPLINETSEKGAGEEEVLDLFGFAELVKDAIRRHQVFEVSRWGGVGVPAGAVDGAGKGGEGVWGGGDTRRVLTALKCRLMLEADVARLDEEDVDDDDARRAAYGFNHVEAEQAGADVKKEVAAATASGANSRVGGDAGVVAVATEVALLRSRIAALREQIRRSRTTPTSAVCAGPPIKDELLPRTVSTSTNGGVGKADGPASRGFLTARRSTLAAAAAAAATPRRALPTCTPRSPEARVWPGSVERDGAPAWAPQGGPDVLGWFRSPLAALSFQGLAAGAFPRRLGLPAPPTPPPVADSAG